jgi:deoxyribonuclease V
VKIHNLHPWDLSPREAIALQRELAARVIARGSPSARRVQLIAGADVAFDKPNGRGTGAIVALAWPSLEIVEQVVVESPVTFPYVPGLLSFRETPVLLDAFARLKSAPDLLMIDGHGYAHPRRFGFACHLGLLLDIPTIGVAKSPLVGAHGRLGVRRASRVDLVDRGEVIGALLRTCDSVRPIYVSVGHRIALAAAERWTLACATRYRLPEPARLADRLSRVAKRRMLDATLDIVIEQRAGEPGRWEWESDRDAVIFRHDLEPMPEHYGCSTYIMNPADGELLDVILVDDRHYERGQRTTVRVIDVLPRRDGDDKLLAVPVDRVSPSPRRLKRAREALWSWFIRHDKPVTRWGGEDDALALIAECRAVAQY